MAIRFVGTLALVLVVTAGCSRGATAPPAAPESETLDVTSWTEQTELFMEHPPLVAGQTVRFAVHLTRLADFSALNAGRPSIEMTPEGAGSSVTLPGSDPLRPGAFRVEGTLPAAGRYRWALLVNAPGLSDRHDLGVTTVFGDEATAVADAQKQPDADPDSHRVSERAAVDQSIRNDPGSRRRSTSVDPRSSSDRAGDRRRGDRVCACRRTIRVG